MFLAPCPDPMLSCRSEAAEKGVCGLFRYDPLGGCLAYDVLDLELGNEGFEQSPDDLLVAFGQRLDIFDPAHQTVFGNRSA